MNYSVATMYNAIAKENRNKKSFKSNQIHKEIASILTVSMFVHLVMVISKEKHGEDAALGDHLFFQSAGRTWDLLTWNSSKNKKTRPMTAPLAAVKSWCLAKGEARSQHSQESLPEPQHRAGTGTRLGFISDAALLYSCFCPMVQHGSSALHFSCVPCFCLELSADRARICPETTLHHS